MNKPTEEQKEIRDLREKLLKLGQPIIIPARELPQPKCGSDFQPTDIIINPFFEESKDD